AELSGAWGSKCDVLGLHGGRVSLGGPPCLVDERVSRHRHSGDRAGRQSRQRRSRELSRPPQHRGTAPMTSQTQTNAEPLLRVDALSINIGERPVVERVSFDIRAGETLCLVGASGSGKSVTASAIAGLLAKGLEISAGRVLLEGRELT